jgi:hypothetical protein
MTTHNNLNSKPAPSFDAIVRLPGPKTKAAVIIPGPKIFHHDFPMLFSLNSLSLMKMNDIVLNAAM